MKEFQDYFEKFVTIELNRIQRHIMLDEESKK